LKDGGSSREVDAGERAFAQTNAGGGGRWIVVGADAEQVAEKLGDVGVVADDENVLRGGPVAEKALELGEGRGGSKRGGDQDFLFVAGLGSNELGGLLGALEGARDDEIEVGIEGVEDVGELQALCLAVLVEGTLDIEERIGAANTGAGVAENI